MKINSVKDLANMAAEVSGIKDVNPESLIKRFFKFTETQTRMNRSPNWSFVRFIKIRPKKTKRKKKTGHLKNSFKI